MTLLIVLLKNGRLIAPDTHQKLMVNTPLKIESFGLEFAFTVSKCVVSLSSLIITSVSNKKLLIIIYITFYNFQAKKGQCCRIQGLVSCRLIFRSLYISFTKLFSVFHLF